MRIRNIFFAMYILMCCTGIMTAQVSGGMLRGPKKIATKPTTQSKKISSQVVSYSNGLLSVNNIKYRMIYVEGGSFQMGATSEQGSDACYNETPVHTVELSDYFIGQTEVTQELWHEIMNTNPSFSKSKKNPVEYVSWDDCQTFITKLNQLTGQKFRLPTEAEWEYAARGGKKSKGCKYAGSNIIDEVAWFDGNSNTRSHPVAGKLPNELGIYDMTGNLSEWCHDYYSSDYYKSSSQFSPNGPLTGNNRVFRGGSYGNIDEDCRVSWRGNYVSDNCTFYIGFRLALTTDN